jgi:hypothetical protein
LNESLKSRIERERGDWENTEGEKTYDM